MASMEIITLSSSPPLHSAESIHKHQDLPDCRVGSRAAPILVGAVSALRPISDLPKPCGDNVKYIEHEHCQPLQTQLPTEQVRVEVEGRKKAVTTAAPANTERPTLTVGFGNDDTSQWLMDHAQRRRQSSEADPAKCHTPKANSEEDQAQIDNDVLEIRQESSQSSNMPPPPAWNLLEVGQQIFSAAESPAMKEETKAKPRSESDSKTKKKAKSPKKGPVTVTARATKQFSALDENDCRQQKAQLEFEAHAKPVGVPRRTGSKKRVKADGTGSNRRSRLLSPERAQLKASGQDLFFGTSSQLTRDEPLEYIRDLQRATKLSEDGQELTKGDTVLTVSGQQNRVGEKQSSLWCAGSRANDGSVLEANFFWPADECSIQTPPMVPSRLKPVRTSKKPAMMLASTPRSVLQAVSDNPAVSQTRNVQTASLSKSMPSNLGEMKAPTRDRSEKPWDSAETEQEYHSNSVNRTVGDTCAHTDEIIDVDPPNPLSSPLRCPSQNTPALGAELQLSPSQSKRNAKKPAKRRKKAENKEHEDELKTEKQLRAQFPGISKRLFPNITLAIKSTAPLATMRTPSWHQKILLYDPIVLEDLTDWLNGGPLDMACQTTSQALGFKRVRAWMVQKWCEENSVCCIWKEGLRGGIRLQY